MEAKHYRILPGHRFNDGQRDYMAGDVIELGDDIAAQHADKVELVQPDKDGGEAQTSVQTPDAGG